LRKERNTNLDLLTGDLSVDLVGTQAHQTRQPSSRAALVNSRAASLFHPISEFTPQQISVIETYRSLNKRGKPCGDGLCLSEASHRKGGRTTNALDARGSLTGYLILILLTATLLT
jgi:hypothetical protein